MAGTNEFLPFGLAGGADVITQSAYSALAARTAGFSTGTAVSGQLNKVWRQSAFVASAIAQIIANNNVNAPDDGNQSTFVTNLLAALFNAPALTGNPTATTQTAGNNSTRIATTAFIATALASYYTSAQMDTSLAAKAPLASPVLTGIPTAPTAAVGTNTNQLATMAALLNALGSYLTTAAAAAAYQPILGYTPVQQGGGAGQGSNKVFIGWNSTDGLRLQIDATTFNSYWPINLLAGALVQTTPAPGDSTTKVASTAFVQAAAASAAAAIALGIGQSWVDVTASRAFNTTYTNGTARPIMVNLGVISVGGSQTAIALVNGVQAAQFTAVSNTSQGANSFVVPPGHTYRLNTPGNLILPYWSELR